jgi:glutamate-1-semialdehyde 2,1-aminomutase
LVIDEVITGFRWSPGGCQAVVGVTPDLSSLGKMVSGGLPGAAVCGRADVMDLLQIRAGDPEWNRYRHLFHPGTWNANPLCAVAGLSLLKIAATGEPQRRAEAMAKRLVAGFNRQIEKRGLEACAYNASSAIHLHIGPCQKCDRQLCLDAGKRMSSEDILALHRHLLLNGVNLLRGTIGWVSAVHTDQDIEQTVDAFGAALDGLADEGVAKAA